MSDSIIELYCSNFNPTKALRFLYRYEIVVNNYENGEITTCVYLNKYPVVRETNMTNFIDDYGRERRVLKGGGKRFAYEQIDDAQFSLKKRTSWRQTHAHWALTKSHEAIDAFNRVFEPNKPLTKVGGL